MRLTKTEQRLLDTARSSHNGRASVSSGVGRGPKGGAIKYGMRDREAVTSLRNKGLIRIVDHFRYANASRGFTVHETDVTFEIIKEES